MRQRISAAGWVIAALGVVGLAAMASLRTLFAHGDAAFNRWVGWDTAAALPLTGLGTLLVILDKIGSTREARGESDLGKVENDMRGGRNRAPVVVTCRDGEYEALGPGLDRATHIEMTGLSGEEAADYLGDQFRTADEMERWEPVIASLKSDPQGSLARQLSTPWRLTLALAAFRDVGDPSLLIPEVWLSKISVEVSLEGVELNDHMEFNEEDYRNHVERHLLGGYVPAAVHLHAAGTPYTENKVMRWLTSLASGLHDRGADLQSATDIRSFDW